MGNDSSKNRVKNKVGRKTVMTSEVLDKLKAAFMMGATDEEACLYAEISADALYKYQREKPQFIKEKEEWKRNPILKAKVTIYKNLDQVETARWYLERKAKDEFSTRQELKDVTEESDEFKFFKDLIQNNEHVANNTKSTEDLQGK